jgi:hypothetical protein
MGLSESNFTDLGANEKMHDDIEVLLLMILYTAFLLIAYVSLGL